MKTCPKCGVKTSRGQASKIASFKKEKFERHPFLGLPHATDFLLNPVQVLSDSDAIFVDALLAISAA